MDTKEKDKIDEPHPSFPSGEWEGFYTYIMGPTAEQHQMSFVLTFRNNQVSGSGGDDVGGFTWKGTYDKETMHCRLTKHYVTHQVHYKGHVDENGIWGTWTISSIFSGGFHIWPKTNGKENEKEEEIESTIEVKNAETKKFEI